MLEPLFNPIFRYVSPSKPPKEISALVRRIEQIALPLFAIATILVICARCWRASRAEPSENKGRDLNEAGGKGEEIQPEPEVEGGAVVQPDLSRGEDKAMDGDKEGNEENQPSLLKVENEGLGGVEGEIGDKRPDEALGAKREGEENQPDLLNVEDEGLGGVEGEAGDKQLDEPRREDEALSAKREDEENQPGSLKVEDEDSDDVESEDGEGRSDELRSADGALDGAQKKDEEAEVKRESPVTLPRVEEEIRGGEVEEPPVSEHANVEERRNIEGEKEAEGSGSSESALPREIELSEQDRKISAALNPNVPLKKLQKILLDMDCVPTTGQPLEEQKRSHEASKVRFQTILASCPEFQSSVEYVRPGNLAAMEIPKSENRLYTTSGRFRVYGANEKIDKQILEFSMHDKTIHIFSLSSHYNAGESRMEYNDLTDWPKPGQAGRESEHDSTQGALGQKVNKKLFELTNAYLTNGGFNMLAHVLDAETYQCMRNGHLLLASEGDIAAPTVSQVVSEADLKSLNNEEFWDARLSEMARLAECFSEERLSLLELPCLKTVPDGGKNPVHLILNAAPAIGAIQPYATLLKIIEARRATRNIPKEDEEGVQPEALYSEETGRRVNHLWESSKFLRDVSQWITFANFMAQFEYTLSIAKATPEKRVVLHLTGTGLGRCQNDPIDVADALLRAAHVFDKRLQSEDIQNVTVAFSRLNSGCNEVTKTCAKKLLDAKGLDGQSLFTKYTR